MQITLILVYGVPLSSCVSGALNYYRSYLFRFCHIQRCRLIQGDMTSKHYFIFQGKATMTAYEYRKLRADSYPAYHFPFLAPKR